MPEIKDIPEEFVAYAIESTRINSDEWGFVTVHGNDGETYIQSFETLEEAQQFIDAHMPDGWKARIVVGKGKIIGYDGVKH
jgi:hypothetical protein